MHRSGAWQCLSGGLHDLVGAGGGLAEAAHRVRRQPAVDLLEPQVDLPIREREEAPSLPVPLDEEGAQPLDLEHPEGLGDPERFEPVDVDDAPDAPAVRGAHPVAHRREVHGPVRHEPLAVRELGEPRSHVVARQAGVGAHGPPIGGRNVPVPLHLGEHEARDPVPLVLACLPHAIAVICRDVDGGARHQLARGISTSFSGMGRDTCDPPALAYYIAVVLAPSALAWSGASPQAQDAAARPPRPRLTNAQPHVVGNGPCAFVRSRIRPNTIGATAPAPKPRKERSARAAPRCAAPTSSVSAVESTGESPRAVKPYTAPTTKTTATGRPMSQPKVSEHTALVAARPKRTIRRPSPSESRPIELDATSPITWKAAETYDASSAALTEPAPETAKAAATKAGVHAHMPRSSQE